MTDHKVGSVDELPENGRLIVEIKGREIGVFNVAGEYFACLNWCAHQGGPLCEGPLGSALKGSFDKSTLETALYWDHEGTTVECPWHGWEFDVESGTCLSRTDVRLPTYPVTVTDGQIVISL